MDAGAGPTEKTGDRSSVCYIVFWFVAYIQNNARHVRAFVRERSEDDRLHVAYEIVDKSDTRYVARCVVTKQIRVDANVDISELTSNQFQVLDQL